MHSHFPPLPLRALYLCRHAKSSWTDATLSDFDRPLNERGLRNAPYMAKVFHDRGEPVDLIVTSTAERALATALHFAAAMGIPETAVLRKDELYHASVPTIMDLLHRLPADARRIMVFGHNPGLTEAVEYFSGEDIGNLPTCGIVRIDFPGGEQNMMARDLGTLVFMDYPRRHAGQG